MLAHSFWIESSSKLLVTRTGIKARTNSISSLWFPWPICMFFFFFFFFFLLLLLLLFKWEDVKYGLWMIKRSVFSVPGWLAKSDVTAHNSPRPLPHFTLAHWSQVSDRCPLDDLLSLSMKTTLTMTTCKDNRLVAILIYSAINQLVKLPWIVVITQCFVLLVVFIGRNSDHNGWQHEKKLHCCSSNSLQRANIFYHESALGFLNVCTRWF